MHITGALWLCTCGSTHGATPLHKGLVIFIVDGLSKRRGEEGGEMMCVVVWRERVYVKDRGK